LEEKRTLGPGGEEDANVRGMRGGNRKISGVKGRDYKKRTNGGQGWERVKKNLRCGGGHAKGRT